MRIFYIRDLGTCKSCFKGKLGKKGKVKSREKRKKRKKMKVEGQKKKVTT